MKDVPFSVARKFCEDYEKDQVIILSWDRTTKDTWITTFGVSDEDSEMAANGGNEIRKFLKLKGKKLMPLRFSHLKEFVESKGLNKEFEQFLTKYQK